MPRADTGFSQLNINLPPGSTLAQTDATLRHLSDITNRYPAVAPTPSPVRAATPPKAKSSSARAPTRRAHKACVPSNNNCATPRRHLRHPLRLQKRRSPARHQDHPHRPGPRHPQRNRAHPQTTNIVESLIRSNESKEPKQQGIHISQPPLFPQPFDPCHVFYIAN